MMSLPQPFMTARSQLDSRTSRTVLSGEKS